MFRIGRANGKTNLEIEMIKYLVKKEMEKENKRVEGLNKSKPSFSVDRNKGNKIDFFG